jgi:hypothetical protein
MEIRSVIALKLKGLSNRKVADLLKINRKTVDNYTSRFSALHLGFDELINLTEPDLRDLFTEEPTDGKAALRTTGDTFFRTSKSSFASQVATLQTLWKEYLQQNPEGL